MADFDIDVIINRLNELTNFMNSVNTLSKKIPQLPLPNAGQKSVAVWNDTTAQTEQFDLSAALNGVFAQTNGIIQLGTIPIPRTGDTFTFDVGYIWRLNGIVNQNIEIERTIDVAGAGNHRIDIAVLAENNDIYIVQGPEVPLADTVQQPPTPPNTLFLCSFSIEEDVIGGGVIDSAILFFQKVRIRKGYLNTDELTNQIGDIFQFGMIFEDKPVFVDFAVYIGGDVEDNNNYVGMTWKEYDIPAGGEFGPDIGPDLGS